MGGRAVWCGICTNRRVRFSRPPVRRPQPGKQQGASAARPSTKSKQRAVVYDARRGYERAWAAGGRARRQPDGSPRLHEHLAVVEDEAVRVLHVHHKAKGAQDVALHRGGLHLHLLVLLQAGTGVAQGSQATG